jgi:hypothetical protein
MALHAVNRGGGRAAQECRRLTPSIIPAWHWGEGTALAAPPPPPGTHRDIARDVHIPSDCCCAHHCQAVGNGGGPSVQHLQVCSSIVPLSEQKLAGSTVQVGPQLRGGPRELPARTAVRATAAPTGGGGGGPPPHMARGWG